jgi:hypothetical protein
MRYLRWFAAALGGALLFGFLGLLAKPSQFAAPAAPDATRPVRLARIPAGLPAPVDRWYRAEFPQGLPVYDSVVMRGTGTMRMAGVALPFRHLVELRPGRGFYRKMDITWFDIPFLHGLDTFVDGTGVMNTPVGRVDGPKIDQGANVVSWLELLAVPGVLAESPGVRWEPIDQASARLVVPFADAEDSIVVGFDPRTGEPTTARASRYRGADSAEKTGWVATMSNRRRLPGGMGRLAARMDAKWDDDTKPWATFEYEAAWPNAATPGFDAAALHGGVKIGASR